MKFIDFKKLLKFPVFSFTDILKVDPAFDRKRLVEWKKKGYIIILRNGVYCYADYPRNEAFLYYTSNQVYRPSYISLVSALSHYNLIPEAVYMVTSISTRKTKSFNLPICNFEYKNVRRELFFGYNLIIMDKLTVKMAEPEKALLDYIYLNKINNIESLDSLRINREAAREIIDPGKLNAYLRLYQSEILNQRVSLLKNYLYA
jgi:predicted transcriptional regulator of viral defense system